MRMQAILVGICSTLLVVGAAAQTTVTTSGGTVNTVPLYSGSSTIGNSTITQSGGNVGIGTTSPQALIHIVSPSSNGVYPKLELTDGISFGHTWEIQSGIPNVSDQYFGIKDTTSNV